METVNKGKKWTNCEIRYLFEKLKEGVDIEVVAKNLSRTIAGCEDKHRRMMLIYPNLSTEKDEIPSGGEKWSMCWHCSNACTSQCSKPVEGWKAKRKCLTNYAGEPLTAYIVMKCPNYSHEAWADHYDFDAFYTN